MAFISKSKFLNGLQCSKLLWHAYNAKHLFSEPDASTQAIFDQGHEVGELAKQLFPGGIEVGKNIVDIETILKLSEKAVQQRKPMFEAAFAFDGGYARVDILNPADDDAWDIIEVKSSTSVKDVHIADLAFQSFVYAGAGLKIRRCFLMHINSDYVRQGDLDPHELLKQVDVTAKVATMSRQIDPQLSEMAKVIRLKKSPEVAIGKHCDSPYECPLHEHCWQHLQPDNPLTLYRGKEKGFELLAKGVQRITDIPDNYPLNDKQEIQREVARTGLPHVSERALRQFLKGLEYPLYYLDFETFGPALPLFDNASPFQQIPFQFSLHIQPLPGGKLKQISYLAKGRTDPRLKFIKALQKAIGPSGSIITYNAPFEKGMLEAIAKVFPEYQPWVKQINGRVVDLLLPFRAFRYYHPAQHGRCSLKSVLPALTGKSYGDLEIQEGGTASREFLRITFTDVPKAEYEKVRRQLEIYCGQDTEGMAWIVDELRRLVKDSK
jgi:hypothetical protein